MVDIAPARIQTLPPAVAARIAAGEVIERPLSVVRELLDNALDAGARRIAVEVEGGGRSRITVADDGRGIAGRDLRLAVERYSTSKIDAAADLLAVRTLGFRGEALASVAVAADLTIISAPASGRATEIVVEQGQVRRHGPATRAPGTTVTARHLFRDLPARLSALVAAPAENAAISRLIRRYALGYPTVAFTLTTHGRPTLATSGSGDLAVTATELYGAVAAGATVLTPRRDEAGRRCTGLAAGPHCTYATRREVTLFVNGRLVNHPQLRAAIEAGYRDFLPRGRHPLLFLHLHVPPADLDANVHPTKATVRLHDGEGTAALLREAARAAIEPAAGRADAGTALASHLLGPHTEPLTGLGRRRIRERSPDHGQPGWVTATPAAGDAAQPAWLAAGATSEWIVRGRDLGAARLIGQIHDTILVVEGPSGLWLVDQHRAHEQAIFAQLVSVAGEQQAAQTVLEPLVLQVGAAHAPALHTHLEALARLGIVCEPFGPDAFAVRAVPTLADVPRLGPAIRDALAAASPTSNRETWERALCVDIACRSAVRRGTSLSDDAARILLDRLAALAGDDPVQVCPHGQPLVLALAGDDLGRRFDWR